MPEPSSTGIYKLSIVRLGEFRGGSLEYAGSVTMGVRRDVLRLLEEGDCSFRELVKARKHVVWCRPQRVCTVEYMPNTLDALRQPVFKGMRMMWGRKLAWA